MLENWNAEHALRDVISNALDEQFLSRTAEYDIQGTSPQTGIFKDFGRGLQIEHFNLNKNQEKTAVGKKENLIKCSI